MATTSSFGSRAPSQQSHDNLFQKVEILQGYLEAVRAELSKLDEEAKSVKIEKDTVEVYLEDRAESTKTRLMGELKLFENEVKVHIENARQETSKIDDKINVLKQGQLATMQMILSLQRRVREGEVQLGCGEA